MNRTLRLRAEVTVAFGATTDVPLSRAGSVPWLERLNALTPVLVAAKNKAGPACAGPA